MTIVVAGALAYKQWLEGPIAIQPFSIAADAGIAGISPDMLADETKAHISSIYSQAGELFAIRKLGEPTVPLNVEIGHTGWQLQTLMKALGIPMTSAEVSGRVFQDGNGLVLQWTTVKGGEVAVDTYPISAAPHVRTELEPAAGGGGPVAEGSLTARLDRALECLALTTVAGLTPDTAANYLHKAHEARGDAADHPEGSPTCIAEDDAELYSRVSRDEALPPAARVNAFVGLSVHYQYLRHVSEELTMAQAATHLASRTLSCDDPESLPSRWRRFRCRLAAYRPFSDRNPRAAVAAWMQLGAAQSDYAAAAPTLREMQERRGAAIDAYDKVIAINDQYALAYDAKALQHGLRNEISAANAAYQRSLEVGETPAAHIDMGYFSIHGRSDSFDDRALGEEDLAAAEAHFRRAIELAPTYWDAHGGLGYVLYERGDLGDAADVLEEAAQRDDSNRGLRRLLGRAYAGLCRFDKAHDAFRLVHDAHAKQPDGAAAALDAAADWGETLAEFGFLDWAMQQESAVLASNPAHVDALKVRGEAALAVAAAAADPAQAGAGQGLLDLQAAVDDENVKSDDVLNAYLVALIHTQGALAAVNQYESWSATGVVPPLATTAALDAAILPDTRRTRQTYAAALLRLDRGESARHEFEVLSQLGATPAPYPLLHVSTLPNGAAAGEVNPARTHACGRPTLAAAPLL